MLQKLLRTFIDNINNERVKNKKDAREEFKTVKKNVKNEALKQIVKDLEPAIFGYDDDKSKEELEAEELDRRFNQLKNKKILEGEILERKFETLKNRRLIKERIDALIKKLNNSDYNDDDDDDDDDDDMILNNLLSNLNTTTEIAEKNRQIFLKIANKKKNKDNETRSKNNDDNGNDDNDDNDDNGNDDDDNDDNDDNGNDIDDDNGNDIGNVNTNPKKGSGVFTLQKEFGKLLTFLAQLHAGNNSKKLKNDINQLLKALYNSKEISELVYENLIAAI